MRLVLVLLALAAACTPTAPGAPEDGGQDAGAADSGVDLGRPDTGAPDGGVDLGPACECAAVGPCCDGCHPLPTSTVCNTVRNPDRCWPDSYILGGRYGWTETRTHCGGSGACDGAEELVEVSFGCSSDRYCVVRSQDMQAVCRLP